MKTRAAVACETRALLSTENVGMHGLRATGSGGHSMGCDVALAWPRPLPA